MDTVAFNKHLSDRVETIRSEHGDSVAITEVADLVGTLMGNIEGDISSTDIHIHSQIGELVDFIKKARGEIAALQPHEINEQHIPAATDELSAIVEATEEATNTILDAAEKLGEIGAEVGGENETKIMDVITSIYEASNFQDITGQRINKVVSTLQYIETAINKMASSIGAETKSDAERQDVSADLKANDTRSDADLLNGPQLDGDGISQDDIDALLADFD
jgi:chemotaxis protein CheZ